MFRKLIAHPIVFSLSFGMALFVIGCATSNPQVAPEIGATPTMGFRLQDKAAQAVKSPALPAPTLATEQEAAPTIESEATLKQEYPPEPTVAPALKEIQVPTVANTFEPTAELTSESEAMPVPTPEPTPLPPTSLVVGEVELERVGESVSGSTLIYIRESDSAQFEEISYHFSGEGPGSTEDFAVRDGMLCMEIGVNPDTGPYEFWLYRDKGSTSHGRVVQEFSSRASGSSSCVTIYYPVEDRANQAESFVGTVRGMPVFQEDRIIKGFFTFPAGTYRLEVHSNDGAPWKIRVCTKEPFKEGFEFNPGCNEPSVGEPLKEHSELVHLSIGQLWYLTVADYEDYCGVIRDDYWHVMREHDSTTFVFVSTAANQLGLTGGEIANRLTMCGIDLDGADCVGTACDWETPPKLLPDGRLIPPVFKDRK